MLTSQFTVISTALAIFSFLLFSSAIFFVIKRLYEKTNKLLVTINRGYN